MRLDNVSCSLIKNLEKKIHAGCEIIALITIVSRMDKDTFTLITDTIGNMSDYVHIFFKRHENNVEIFVNFKYIASLNDNCFRCRLKLYCSVLIKNLDSMTEKKLFCEWALVTNDDCEVHVDLSDQEVLVMY